MEKASSILANSLANEPDLDIYYLIIFPRIKFFSLNKKVTLLEPKEYNIDHLSFFKTILFIRKSILTLSPNSILVYGKIYGALTALALIGNSYRLFISERSSPTLIWPLKHRILCNISYQLRKPYGVICQTFIAETNQKKYYGKNVYFQVIPNLIEGAKCFPEIKKRKVIACVGRFGDTLKGFDRMIDIFSIIADKCDWNLEIVGGKSDEMLEKKIDFYQLRNRILLIDKQDDLYKYLASISIFALPSRSEGFPNVLCEAMLAGVPAVSFDIFAGPSDIINHENNGYLIEDNNLIGFADCILTLIRNPEKREYIGSNAKKLDTQLNYKLLLKKYKDFLLRE